MLPSELWDKMGYLVNGASREYTQMAELLCRAVNARLPNPGRVRVELDRGNPDEYDYGLTWYIYWTGGPPYSYKEWRDTGDLSIKIVKELDKELGGGDVTE